MDVSGNVVGSGDIGIQAEQIFKNLEMALAAGGARLDDVIKWNIYVIAGQPIRPALQVFQRVWGDRSDPPLITGVFVSGLAQPLSCGLITLAPQSRPSDEAQRVAENRPRSSHTKFSLPHHPGSERYLMYTGL